ncbi:MAG TPA: SDR family NAD(P)-dependent oxidoreductase, partial [Armatimonadetes bacterium]|nr:SDR family NAD(P)-dependent oxidoreductase [Armatimonadota bacterium]
MLMKELSVKELFSVAGQIAFVTGGGRGIGKVFCKTLAEAGAKVAVIDIDLETAQQTAQEIKQLGGDAIAVQADVTKAEDVSRAVEATVNHFGRIDICV